MKKLIASLFVATLMAAGLVTVSGGTSASAAQCIATQYVACQPTTTRITGKAKAKRGKRAAVKVPVAVTGGARANGTVLVTVRRGKKVIAKRNVRPGATVRFKVKKKGKYVVRAVFSSANGSFQKDSTAKRKVIRVR
jgi:hypothetical protein